MPTVTCIKPSIDIHGLYIREAFCRLIMPTMFPATISACNMAARPILGPTVSATSPSANLVPDTFWSDAIWRVGCTRMRPESGEMLSGKASRRTPVLGVWPVQGT